MSATLAGAWAEVAVRGLVHGTLAFVLLYLLWWPLRRRAPAQLACVLFSLALLKLALPFPLPAPAWLSPLAMDHWLVPAPPREDVLLLLPATTPSAALSTNLAADPAVAHAAAPAGQDLSALAFWAWLLGVAFLSLRFLRNELRTGRAVRAARPLQEGELGVDLATLRARAGVRRRVRFLESDAVTTPAAGGLLRPYVLVPPGLAASLPGPQLTFVLMHELAHIRRGDLAVAAVQRLVQILWFFHPAVWLASRLVEQHRELACDQDALARSGATRRECGAAFLSVVAWVNGRQVEPTATLAMFDPNRVLKRRLMQILTANRPGHASRWLGAAYLAFAAAITLPSAKVSAATPVDAPEFVVQDEGQREQIEQLRKQIAELRKQHAELARQLARQKTEEKRKATRDDDSDADEHHESDVTVIRGADGSTRTWRVEGTPFSGTRVIRMKDGKPLEVRGKARAEEEEAEADEGETKTRTWVWRDGKLEGTDGKAFTFDLGDRVWELPKGLRGGWTVRTGDGDARVFRADGDGQVLFVGPDGKAKKVEGLPGGFRYRWAPGVKVERNESGQVIRIERKRDGEEEAQEIEAVEETKKAEEAEGKVKRLRRTKATDTKKTVRV